MKVQGVNSIFLMNAYDSREKEIQKNEVIKLHKEFGTYKTEFDSAALPPFPEEKDYMYFPFRHLSATIVGGGTWKATDFTDEKVLKRGASLLNQKPAYLNHYLAVGQEIGYVDDIKFNTSYTNAKGDKVPAGLDGPFIIDSKLYPDLVRKLNAKVSPIQSASVSVLFEWEASHDFEKENDFYWHLGEIIDGSMVRRRVVEITDFYESSLVWLGADPYAKMLVNGEVVNIDKSSVVSQDKFEKDTPEYRHIFSKYKKYYVFETSDPKISLDLKRWSEAYSKQHKVNDMTVQEKIAKKLGIPVEQVTPEMIEQYSFVKTEDFDAFQKFNKKDHDENIQKKDGEITSLKKDVSDKDAEIATLKSDKAKLEGEVNSNKVFVEFGQKAIADTKKMAKDLYTKFSNGKTEKTILDEIESSTNVESLNAKIKMWGGSTYEMFGATCKKCGSNEVEFRKSAEEDTEPNPKKVERPVLAELARR